MENLSRKQVRLVVTMHGRWHAMIARCEHKKHPCYCHYGGRGIHVCERWHVFEDFFEDVSQLEHFGEPGYTLDRIDVNGNYEPGNVRWANAKTQATNRRATHFDNGESLPEIAQKLNISYWVILARWLRGDRGDRLRRPADPRFAYKNRNRKKRR